MGSLEPEGSPSSSPISSQSPPVKVAWNLVSLGLPDLSHVVSSFEIVDGDENIDLPDDVLIDVKPLWDAYVVGYFIGDSPHVGKVHATVNRMWVTPEKPAKVDVQFLNQTIVLFRIENETMRSRVLKRQYWHIADVPVVRHWNPEAAHERPDLTSLPLWLDLKSVPGRLYFRKGLSFLGSIVGNPVRLHPNTKHCTRLDMARILVEVNLQTPLPNRINLMEILAPFRLLILGYRLDALCVISGAMERKHMIRRKR